MYEVDTYDLLCAMLIQRLFVERFVTKNLSAFSS